MASIYDLTMDDISGEQIHLEQFRGQVLLVVNVASACGLTPHYEGLQQIHDQFDDVVVLGFPCNQFGAQEPGTDEEIHEFACSRFDVTFPMFSKIEVNGPGAAPLYQLLTSEQPGDGDTADIAWNFEKFLVDREGNVVRRFPPMTHPDDVAAAIPEYL